MILFFFSMQILDIDGLLSSASLYKIKYLQENV